jgi:hypothetical protein
MCINLKDEAFDKWLSSKQDLHKSVYKGKKTIVVVALIKAETETWDTTCLKVNCELEFKRSRKA